VTLGKILKVQKTVSSFIPRQCPQITFVIDWDQNGFCVKLMEDLHARVLCSPHPQEPIPNHNVHKYFWRTEQSVLYDRTTFLTSRLKSSNNNRGKYCLIFLVLTRLSVILYSVPWLIFWSIIRRGGAYSKYIQQVCLPIQNVPIQGNCCTIFYSNTTQIWHN
jgi:hypothetical protein